MKDIKQLVAELAEAVEVKTLEELFMDKAYLLPENIENQLLDTIASLIEKGKKEVPATPIVC